MQKETVKKNTAITLTVNGVRKSVCALSPRELLGELEMKGDFFAIAVNRRVIPRARWDEAAFKDGDNIEIVAPRQGG